MPRKNGWYSIGFQSFSFRYPKFSGYNRFFNKTVCSEMFTAQDRVFRGLPVSSRSIHLLCPLISENGVTGESVKAYVSPGA